MFAKWTLTLLCLACLPTSAFAADIVIINGDDPGEGFNDPTPAAPVGGNTGVTIGAQRLNAFIAAASIWGANISSPVTIRIVAQFDPLPCSDTSVLLGSAGPRLIVRNFPGAPFANTWYPKALANKLAGFELFSSFPDINARFNSVLGQPSCFGGIGWYYGLDNNHGALLDLVSTILHEFAHGLGMISITGSTGVLLAGSPSIYNRYMFDSTIGKTWDLMTDVERVASAINTNNLSWIGPNVLTAAPSVLSRGAPRLQINAPPNLKGDYRAGRPLFGRPLEFPSTTGELGLVIDGAGLSLTDGCEPLTGPAAQAVKNKIALVDFGNCLTKVKVKNAQDAGARGVVIVDNGVRSPPPDFGTPEPSITILAVFITLADGNLLKSVVSSRWPASSGVNVSIGLDHRIIAGLDTSGRPLLWAPFPFQSGSSLSHWDTIASPNQLMEPFAEPDLPHSVGPPRDLTLPLLKDLGW